MDKLNTTPAIEDTGVLNDITAPYVNRMKQQADLEAQVEAEGAGMMAVRGAANSALGFFVGRQVKKLQHWDEAPDEAFQAEVAARVVKDHPTATGSEREFLAEAVNENDYTWRREMLERHTADNELLSQSYVGSAASLAVDVAPDLIAGVGIAARVGRMAAGAARIGTAFGANAAQGAASEYLRQKAALEDTNMRAVMFSSLVSGGAGAVFDGVMGAKLANTRHAAGKATNSVAGAKAVATFEAEVLEGAADATVAASKVDAAAALKAGGDEVLPPAGPVTAGLDNEALAAIQEHAARHFETLDSARAAQAAADEFPDTAFAQAFQRAQAKLEAKVAKAQAAGQVAKAEADVASGAAPAAAVAAPDTPALAPHVTDVEAAALAGATPGRMVLTDTNGAVFKPRFESPVDRALATVGAQTKAHETSVAALDVLRKAFPTETDASLVNMADNFVEQHLMPTLRAGGQADPEVPRWWNQMDPKSFRSAEEHIAAADFPSVAQWGNTAHITASDITALATDAGGHKLKAAVVKANLLVNVKEVESGFANLAKHPSTKPLAANLNARIKAFSDASGGAKPDLHLVKSWLGQELYNRSVFQLERTLLDKAADAVVGMKVSPIVGKALMVSGGAVVLSMVIATSAYAGTGGGVGGSAGGAALVGLLVGGKFLKKALSKTGKGAELAANIAKAQKMQREFVKSSAVTTPDEAALAAHVADVEAKTGLKLVDGQPHFNGTAEELKACLDTAAMSADDADKLVGSLKATDLTTGKELDVLTHFDGEKVIQSVKDLDSAPLIKTIVKIGGKLHRVRTPGFASEIRADFQRLADDASATMRGMAHFVAQSTIGRTGKVANEMTADVMFNKYSLEYASKTTELVKDGVKAWRQETGAKKPHFMNLKAQEMEHAAFDKEVAQAWRNPGDPRVSQAARDTAGKMLKQQEQIVKEAQQARSFMESKGIKLAEDDPVRIFSEMKPGEHGFPRFINQAAVKDVVAQIGEDGVKQLLAKALRSSGSGLADNHVERVSQRIFDALFAEKDNFGAFMKKENGQALTRALRESGVPENVVEDVKALFGMREMGPPAPGAAKLDLDTELSFTVDGQSVKFRLADLYEQSATATFSRWSRSGIGAISMALPGAHAGVNLADDAVWATLMRKARSEGASQYAMDTMQAYRERVLGYGRDADTFGNPGTISRSVRGLANYWLGSNFLFAQVGDAGSQGVGVIAKAFRTIPAMYKLRNGISSGAIGLEELVHIRSMTGAGLESVSASVANVANGVDAAAGIVDKLGHWQRKFSGMGIFGDSMSVIAAKDMQDNLLKYAFTGEIDKRLWKHYAVYGIDQATADAMVPMLKEAAEGFEEGTFKGVSKEALQAVNFDLAKRYEMALYRRGKSVNGEASGWGEGARWLRSSELGQFVGQLQSTALVITQRTQRDIANFDGLVVQAWLTSFAFAAVSYMAKVGITHHTDPDKRNKLLTPAEIFKAAVRGSSFAGIWPNLVDASLTYGLQRDPLFSNAAGGKSGAGQVAVQGAMKTPISAIGAIMGLITGKEGDRLTAAEVRSIKTMTLNVWWLNPVASFLAADLPEGNAPAPKK